MTQPLIDPHVSRWAEPVDERHASWDLIDFALLRRSFAPCFSHISLNCDPYLHPDVLQCLSVTLLEWILCLCIPNQLRVLLTPRDNARSVRDRVADNTGLELQLRLYDLSILHKLLNLEHRQGLSNGDEECVVSDITTRAHATPVTECPGARIRFWSLAEEALRAEGHGICVDGRVMCEPPVLD